MAQAAEWKSPVTAEVMEDVIEPNIAADVLVVNDDENQLVAMQAILESLEQSIVTARSGEEALKRLLEQDFAVILLDVKMSGLDGYETAALLRQREKSSQIPIIFITAYDASETHISRGYSLGAVDYIHAPIVPEILRAKVAVFIELHKKTEIARRQADLLRDKQRREYERRLQEAKQREEREKERRIAAVMAEKAEELARSNADLDQFAYLASHDLREPLRTVASYSQQLGRYFDSGPEGREVIERIVSGVHRMDQLINDLYTFSQVGRQGQAAPTDFQRTAEIACDNLRAAIDESEASVEFDNLPTAMAVPSEAVRLMQNLIGNAIKFRRDEPVEVRVVAAPDGDFWRFTVADNGIGIEPQYCERIFRPGERLHGKSRYPGTGLGLTICRKIVERLGGRIWIESDFGLGSRVHFTLPSLGPDENVPEGQRAVPRRPR